MKYLILSIIFYVSSIFSSPVFADTTLHIRVAGTQKDNTYFLCLDGVGCVSMFEANRGQNYPFTPGKINRIYMVNSGTFRLYPQALPASCNITVNSNETLTISGKVVKTGANAYINNLHCSVTTNT